MAPGWALGERMSERLEDILSNPYEREALRRHILSYPGESEESAERKLRAYEERVEAKKILMGRGLDWNALAEAELDRGGYLRPPGWGAVFCYPDSRRLRNPYVTLAATLVGLTFWFFH